MKRRGVSPRALSLGVLLAAGIFTHPPNAGAQVLVDPNLGVSTVVEHPVGLVDVGGDEPLAVPGVVLEPAAAVDGGPRCSR